MEPCAVGNGQDMAGGMETQRYDGEFQSYHLQALFGLPVPYTYLMSQTTGGDDVWVGGVEFDGPRRPWMSLQGL
jgi:hypothetical protein